LQTQSCWLQSRYKYLLNTSSTSIFCTDICAGAGTDEIFFGFRGVDETFAEARVGKGKVDKTFAETVADKAFAGAGVGGGGADETFAKEGETDETFAGVRVGEERADETGEGGIEAFWRVGGGYLAKEKEEKEEKAEKEEEEEEEEKKEESIFILVVGILKV
jgi:hypothetical protein